MYWIGDLDDQACRYKSKARKNIEKKIHKDTTFLFLVVLRLLTAVTLKPHCGGASNRLGVRRAHLWPALKGFAVPGHEPSEWPPLAPQARTRRPSE